jgi:hypothetical protein
VHSAEEADAVADILAELRRHTGMDFSGYRRPTVERRIANRMMSLGIVSQREYLEHLRCSRDEAEALLGRIGPPTSIPPPSPQASAPSTRLRPPKTCRPISRRATSLAPPTRASR